MSYVHVELVVVWAWGKTVGAVARDPRSGFFAFEYDPSWLKLGIELSPLHLPNAPGVFAFPNLAPHTFHRLPAMLADALPDSFGTSLLDAYIVGLGVAASEITALDRLAYLGSRGMGALEFAPPLGPTAQPETAYEIARLVTEGRNALAGSFGTEDEATSSVRDLLRIGSSAGGLRAKAIIAWNESTGEIRGGQLDAPNGFDHWIIKLDGVDDVAANVGSASRSQEGRIEFAYHLMAKAAGINTAPSRLIEEGGRAHFLTRRFDRIGNRKVHMQTLCGLAHLDFRAIGTHDYAQFLGTIRSLGIGAEAEQQAFRRVAFNVMAANRDDHTKNFAFLLEESGSWKLAPAYDLTCGAALQYRNTSVNGNFGSVSVDHLFTLADRFAIAGVADILAEVADAIDSWSEFASSAGLSKASSDGVAKHLSPMKVR
jgi:serine/threonine-protein kinase HipA